jgi:transposase-like protein
MALTSEEYVKRSGVVCPFCESENINAHNLTHSGVNVFQSCDCTDCGREWTDEYALQSYSED